jgi:hypothetical protein
MAKKIINTGKIYIDESLLKQKRPTSQKDSRGLDRKFYEVDLDSVTAVSTNAANIATLTTNAGGLKRTVLNIGAWNMSASQTATVAHGLTLANIRNVEGVIISDAGTTFYSSGYIGAVGNVQWTTTTIDATNITLTRRPGGDFDNASFSVAANRGYLIVDYV